MRGELFGDNHFHGKVETTANRVNQPFVYFPFTPDLLITSNSRWKHTNMDNCTAPVSATIPPADVLLQ